MKVTKNFTVVVCRMQMRRKHTLFLNVLLVDANGACFLFCFSSLVLKSEEFYYFLEFEIVCPPDDLIEYFFPK